MTVGDHDASAGPVRLAGMVTVAAWLRAYNDHWEVEIDDLEIRNRLEVLARFCASCQKEPDELVAWLSQRHAWRAEQSVSYLWLMKRLQVWAHLIVLPPPTS